MKKRMVSFLIALVLAIGGLTVETPLAYATSSTDIAYPVTGGNIYFDKSTGTVTGCDDSVTEADIPAVIDGVAVTGIGEAAFYGYPITSVNIPDSVISIGGRAFCYCYKLIGVNIPNSVTSIGGGAFFGCSSLISVDIPGSVTSIGDGAFSGCEGLNIFVDSSNRFYSSLDGVLFNKNKTELIQHPGCQTGEYKIPSSVTRIGDEAFYWGGGLTGVDIPNSVTSIGDSAFAYCGYLTSINIPGGVTSIGEWVFEECLNLKDIFYEGTEEQWGKIEIGDNSIDPSVTIHFNSITEPIGEGVTITKTAISADRVFNTGGYGSLKINEVYESDGYTVQSFPKAALIDKTGSFLFPYKDTWHNYYYSDGIVSLASDAYAHYSIGSRGHWVDDKVGFYKLDGTPAFFIDCRSAYPMSEGYALVTCGHNVEDDSFFYSTIDEICLIDAAGNKVFSFDGLFLMGAYGNVEDDGYSGYYGMWGMAGLYHDGLLLCWQYDYPGQIQNHTFPENQGEALLFYINSSGETVLSLPIKYSDSSITEEDVIEGESSLPMDKFSIFSEGYAAVRSASTGKWGYIDKTGELIIPCEYDAGSMFSDGLAPVFKNGKWGYINARNEVVIPFEYDGACGAACGVASVVKNGKCGLVDYQNQIVVPFEYDDISSCENGVGYAIKDGTVYILQLPEDKPVTDDAYYYNAVLQTMMKCLSGQNVTIDTDKADLDGDGRMTLRDLNRLMALIRQFSAANW